MLTVISPAKTLDYDTKPVTERFTLPQYLDDSQELIQQLRELSPAQISELMHLSDLRQLDPGLHPRQCQAGPAGVQG